MGTPESLKKAQKAAWSPEARAKAAATRKRNAAAKAKGLDGLLKHAKLTKKARPVQSIPLDMIPDPPKRTPKKASLKDVKWQKPTKPWTNVKQRQQPTRQEVVLALLKYLNDE